MTVSIIVPVHNAEPWIRECADSILTQNYRDIQVVFVNDGSTDNSSGAIPRDDDRVSVSHTRHMGVAAARNVGLRVSTGELVAFCDADDYLAPDAISNLIAAADGVDMVCGSFRKFGKFEQDVRFGPAILNLNELAQYVLGNLRNPRSNQILSGCWAKLYRRELVDKFPLLATAEDMGFTFDYLMRCKNVRFIEDFVYYNRKHNGSLTTTFDENNKPGLFGFLEGLKYVRQFLLQFYEAVDIEDALDNSKVYHSMLYAQRIGKDALKKVFP